MNAIEQAVAPMKSDAVERAEQKARQMIARYLEQLEAAGWDLDVVAPHPKSTWSRADYRQALSFRDSIKRITNAAKPCSRCDEPYIVVRDQEREERVVEQIREAAGADYDAFVAKLVAKVGEVDVAEITGNHVWGHSILTVRKGGDVEFWKTQQILNVSCLGTLFNQWPTRKVKSPR